MKHLKAFIYLTAIVCALLGHTDTLLAQANTLVANPTSLTFSSSSGSAVASQTLTVTSSSGSQQGFTATAFSPGTWLSVTPTSGTTPQILTVNVNPANASSGTTVGFITISSATASASVSVTLNNTTGTVTTSPYSSNPAQLNFTFPSGDLTPSSEPITISTTGTATTLNATFSTSNGANWLSVSPVSASTPATFTVTVNPQSLNTGTYTGSVNINPTGGGTGIAVPVSVVVGNAATVSATPTQLSFAYQLGTATPAAQTVNITSSAGASYQFTATAQPTTGTGTNTCGTNWLVVTPATGVTPSSISVQVNPTGLTVNNCSGQITISTGSSNPTITIPVSLLVSANPLLQIPSAGPTFAYQTGGATPVAQSVMVTSSSTAISYTVTAAAVNNGPSFVTVTPSGTTPGTISISVNPAVLAGLAPNTYMEDVTVTSAGAGNSPQTFPVTLVVSNTAVLTPSNDAVTFNYQVGQAAPASQVISLNSSGVPLNYTVASTSTNCGTFLSATPANGSTFGSNGQAGQIVLSVATAGLTAGTCHGTVTLTPTAGTAAAVTIPVTLNVSTMPLLNVSVPAINLTAIVGSTASTQQVIGVTSTDGTTALPFTATAATTPAGLTWLSVIPQTGTTPANLTVTINPSLLQAGVYKGTITITSTTGGVLTQTVPVTLTIASGTLTASTTNGLTFTQSLNGAAPATQTITISGVPTGATVGAVATNPTTGNFLTVTNGPGADQITVSANGATLAQGNYTGYVTVLVPGAANSPLTIPVTLSVTAAQTFTFSPVGPLTFTYQSGASTAPATQTVQLTSTGGSLGYTATATSANNFLTVTPASGTAPDTLTVGVNQAVVATLGVGQYAGSITVTSATGGSAMLNVTLTVTAAGPPSLTAIVNGATFIPGAVSPGEIITITGANIGPLTASGVMLTSLGAISTNVGDTQVLFDSVPAPLLYVSANQINAVVPYEVGGRTVTNVTISRNGQTSSALQVNVAATSPGLFTQTENGTGAGAIVNQDGTVNGTLTHEEAAPKGSIVSIYATGEGELTPNTATGSVTSSTGPTFPKPIADVTLTIGGMPATIKYAGESPGFTSGLLQINAVIPTTVASGPQPVVLTIGTSTTTSSVTIQVQ